MTRLSPAELRAIRVVNPDFAARNVEALHELARKPVAHETVEGERVHLSKQVDAADTLLAHMRVHAPDIVGWFIRDYHFENFRIDLADPQHMLAIEVDGGQWKAGGGKHGSRRDYQKTRRITQAGWRLLRFTAGEVADNPLGVIEEIREALSSRVWG